MPDPARRDDAVAEVYELARHLAKQGMTSIEGGDPRFNILAVYAATSAISRSLRRVIEDCGDASALAHLDGIATDVSTRFSEEMPSMAPRSLDA